MGHASTHLTVRRLTGGRERAAALAVTAAASLGLAAVLLHHRHALGDSLRLASVGDLVILAGLQVIVYGLRTLAWGVCLRAAGSRPPAPELNASAAAGFLANCIVPVYVGNGLRMLVLKRRLGAGGPTVGQLVAADGVSLLVESTVAVVVLAACACTAAVTWWWPVLLALVCGLAGYAVWHARRRLRARGWMRGLDLLASRRDTALLAALVGLVLVLQPLRYLIAVEAVGVDAGALQSFLAFVATTVAGALPIGPGPASIAATSSVAGHEGLSAAAAAGVLLVGTGVGAAALYAGVAALWTIRPAQVSRSSGPGRGRSRGDGGPLDTPDDSPGVF